MMEDTDWRPSPCPICGELREASRTPVCKNPDCNPKPPKVIKIHILKDWDGAGGTTNTFSGFITENESVAKEWTKKNTGASYSTYSGILIDDLDHMDQAQIERKKQKALDKLTDEEKELLGL